MTEQQTSTAVAPWWTVPDDPTAAAVLEAQMRIIDAAVRSSRTNGWCSTFEQIMSYAFPDGPPDGSAHYVDSDGWSCRDLDRDGYTREGWHSETGRDRDGYDRSGYDTDGYNREGRDRTGFDRDGWNADHTINRDSEEYRARFRFNRTGYDRDGYDARGRNRDGLTREQYEQSFAFDADGLDVRGADRNGYDRAGNYVGH